MTNRQVDKQTGSQTDMRQVVNRKVEKKHLNQKKTNWQVRKQTSRKSDR